MRVAFAGTPEFAAQALAALLATGHAIPLVLTQPDRKAGRGLQSTASPVKRLALEHGLEVFQPVRLSDPGAVETLRAGRPEVFVVAAYGLILPPAALQVAPLGAINIHASLLPRWRGAAPIQRAILAGDTETGITIMQMDAGLDTGGILRQAGLAISPQETALTLHDRLAALGAQQIIAVLGALGRGPLDALAQPEAGATYARKIDKAEAVLDWRKPCVELERAVRAFNPAPGARTAFAGVDVKVWAAHPGEGQAAPGQVAHAGRDGIVVGCADGTLVLSELQRAGGKRLGALDFLRGLPMQAGSHFTIPAV